MTNLADFPGGLPPDNYIKKVKAKEAYYELLSLFPGFRTEIVKYAKSQNADERAYLCDRMAKNVRSEDNLKRFRYWMKYL